MLRLLPVYGARAAYGVILVTTKNGKVGKTNVSYNGRFSFGETTTSRILRRVVIIRPVSMICSTKHTRASLIHIIPKKITMNYGFAVMIKWKILPVHGW